MKLFRKKPKTYKEIKPTRQIKLATTKEYATFLISSLSNANAQFESSIKYLCFLFFASLIVTESGSQLVLNALYWHLVEHHLTYFQVIKDLFWLSIGLFILYKLRLMFPRTWIDLTDKPPTTKQQIIINAVVATPLVLMIIIAVCLELYLQAH